MRCIVMPSCVCALDAYGPTSPKLSVRSNIFFAAESSPVSSSTFPELGNLHAFCNTCSQANGTVNRYCAAVATYYNSFTNAEAPFRHLDFWCMGDVLAALEDGLDVFTALFGVHEDCAHTYCTQGARS